MTEEQKNYRRLTDYLKEYWDEKRGKRNFPELKEIDINEFDVQFSKDIFLIELVPTITMNIAKTIYLGKNLNTEFKKDSSGVHIKNLIVRFLETPMDAYNKVVETKKPLIHNIEIPCKEIATLCYRQILLPLGDAEKGDIKGILGGMRYKKNKD
ncbi:MAG: PAS domain-containing protein [Rickettsiales bacterium]|nr:PAS domain-containing protein [Pseudomonadota bacterium]MDA0965843.1 PAS domain-containing protein [Pseudomonadota bacterium]MDG4542687.1 PAS domain-containing protein [Rickettsiales bacterium]MDG4545191.1 PAS domain-containing protein [Rickettsiales bacterium]MDG4547314.1 PAS domain-containing protein [Rickettsiales bacterium]